MYTTWEQIRVELGLRMGHLSVVDTRPELVTLSQLVMVELVKIMLETMLVGLRLIVVWGTRRHPVDLLLGVVIMIFVVLHLVDEEMAEEG